MKRLAVAASTALALLALPSSAAAWEPLDVCRAGQIVQVDQDRAVHKVLKPGDTIGACPAPPAPVVQTVTVPGPERLVTVPGPVVEKVRRVVKVRWRERGKPTSCKRQAESRKPKRRTSKRTKRPEKLAHTTRRGS